MKNNLVPVDARLIKAYETYSQTRYRKILAAYNICMNQYLKKQEEREEHFEEGTEWIEVSKRYLAKNLSKDGVSSNENTALECLHVLEDAGILIKQVNGGSGDENNKKHGTLYLFTLPTSIINVKIPPMTMEDWKIWKGNRNYFGREEITVDMELFVDTVLNNNREGLYEKSTRSNGLSQAEQNKLLSQVWFMHGGNEFGWPFSKSESTRIYHPIQQLPPELRLLTVRIDGKTVGSVDIAATQLTILHTMMTNAKERDAFGKIRDDGAYEYLTKWLLENADVVDTQGPKSIWKGSCRQHWEGFWNDFKNKPSMRRELVKKFTSHYCYLNNQDTNGINTILDLFFATQFPVVHALIVILRADKTKNVAIEFQKIEQQIMSGVDVPNVNIHDEVLVQSSQVVDVANGIKQRFSKKFPNVKLLLHIDDGEETRKRFLTTSTFEV